MKKRIKTIYNLPFAIFVFSSSCDPSQAMEHFTVMDEHALFNRSSCKPPEYPEAKSIRISQKGPVRRTSSSSSLAGVPLSLDPANESPRSHSPRSTPMPINKKNGRPLSMQVVGAAFSPRSGISSSAPTSPRLGTSSSVPSSPRTESPRSSAPSSPRLGRANANRNSGTVNFQEMNLFAKLLASKTQKINGGIKEAYQKMAIIKAAQVTDLEKWRGHFYLQIRDEKSDFLGVPKAFIGLDDFWHDLPLMKYLTDDLALIEADNLELIASSIEFLINYNRAIHFDGKENVPIDQGKDTNLLQRARDCYDLLLTKEPTRIDYRYQYIKYSMLAFDEKSNIEKIWKDFFPYIDPLFEYWKNLTEQKEFTPLEDEESLKWMQALKENFSLSLLKKKDTPLKARSYYELAYLSSIISHMNTKRNEHLEDSLESNQEAIEPLESVLFSDATTYGLESAKLDAQLGTHHFKGWASGILYSVALKADQEADLHKNDHDYILLKNISYNCINKIEKRITKLVKRCMDELAERPIDEFVHYIKPCFDLLGPIKAFVIKKNKNKISTEYIVNFIKNLQDNIELTKKRIDKLIQKIKSYPSLAKVATALAEKRTDTITTERLNAFIQQLQDENGVTMERADKLIQQLQGKDESTTGRAGKFTQQLQDFPRISFPHLANIIQKLSLPPQYSDYSLNLSRTLFFGKAKGLAGFLPAGEQQKLLYFEAAKALCQGTQSYFCAWNNETILNVIQQAFKVEEGAIKTAIIKPLSFCLLQERKYLFDGYASVFDYFKTHNMPVTSGKFFKCLASLAPQDEGLTRSIMVSYNTAQEEKKKFGEKINTLLDKIEKKDLGTNGFAQQLIREGFLTTNQWETLEEKKSLLTQHYMIEQMIKPTSDDFLSLEVEDYKEKIFYYLLAM